MPIALCRQVETATPNLLAERAKSLGATRLIGEYRPTAKNAIGKPVADHLPAPDGLRPIGPGARHRHEIRYDLMLRTPRVSGWGLAKLPRDLSRRETTALAGLVPATHEFLLFFDSRDASIVVGARAKPTQSD